MSERIPEVTHRGRLSIDGLDIEVLTLDNGQRIIPKNGMGKALKFIGLSEKEISTLLNPKTQKHSKRWRSRRFMSLTH